MLTLTKIKRSYIIDHVMPSDLDKEDIKHGLYLKEKMLAEMTDDYVKSIIPEWQQIERDYRRRGLTDYMDKIMCGEMSYDDITKPTNCKFECWMRHKNYDSEDNCLDDYDYVDQNSASDGYSEWIKPDDYNVFSLEKIYDEVFQMQICIIGDDCGKYFPFQDSTHSSGWEYVSDDVKLYDFEAGMDDEYYRLFFRLRKGYQHYNWFFENKSWNEANYPNEKVRTILCDPFRLVYCGVSDAGKVPILTGKQWLRMRYPVDMLGLSTFTIKIDNLKIYDDDFESESESETDE